MLSKWETYFGRMQRIYTRGGGLRAVEGPCEFAEPVNIWEAQLFFYKMPLEIRLG